MLPGEPTEEAGSRALGMLLDEHPDVTAVFAANDVMALGALSELAERGLRVPEDVSVIGYDDTPVAAMRYVGLTSIDDRSVEIGRGAGERLPRRGGDDSDDGDERDDREELPARRGPVDGALAVDIHAERHGDGDEPHRALLSIVSR